MDWLAWCLFSQYGWSPVYTIRWQLQGAQYTGIILWMRPANERRRYNVTSSLIGWAHTQNNPWIQHEVSGLWGCRPTTFKARFPQKGLGKFQWFFNNISKQQTYALQTQQFSVSFSTQINRQSIQHKQEGCLQVQDMLSSIILIIYRTLAV